MGIRWLDPLGDELALLTEVEQRYTRLSTQQREIAGNPDIQRLAAAHAEKFGSYAKPGVIAAMAQTGLDPDDPLAAQVAQRSGEMATRQSGGVQYGETVNGSVMSKLWGGVKAVTRTGMMALSAPFEEASALISSVGEAAFDDDPGMGDAWSNYTDRAARSSLGLAVGEVAGDIGRDGFQVSDLDVDTGDGFLVSGGIGERRENDKQRLQLDGQFVTPGRLVARTVVEPGTRPYNFLSGAVDFTANVALDPTNYFLGGLAKAQKAQRTFGVALEDLPRRARLMASTAQVTGPRRGVIGETVDEWLSRPEGGMFLEAVTDTKSPSLIWEGFGKKITKDEAVALAKTESLEESRDVVRGFLGTRVAQKPGAGQFGATFSERTHQLPIGKRSIHGIRFLQDMPEQVVDLNDPKKALDTLDAYMRNAKLPETEIRPFLDEAMGIDGYDAEAWNGLSSRINERIVKELVDVRGLENAQARKLIEPMAGKWAETMREARTYLLDRFGNDIIPAWESNVKEVAGVDVSRFGGVATLLSHARGDFLVLPDVRELRRATSQLAKVYDTPVIGELSKGAVDLLGEKVMPAWKKMAILRPALGVRVIADEQARMAANDDASLWSHPVQAILWAWGRKGAVDPSGNIISEVAKKNGAMSTSLRQAVGDRANVPGYIGDYGRGFKGQSGDAEWWFSYLTRFVGEDVAEEVAGRSGRTIAEIQEAFWDGDLKPAREELIKQLRADRNTGQIPGGLTAREGADHYITNVVQKALWDATGGNHAEGIPGNAELLAGIAQGRIGDFNPYDPSMGEAGLRQARALAVRELDETFRDSMPPVLPKARTGNEGKRTEQLNGALDRMFEMFLGHRSDKYSRSVEYKQALWNEYARQIPFMTDEVANEVIKGARDNNLGDLADAMSKKLRRGTSGQLDRLDLVEDIGHAVALDSTRALLYDLAKRSQMSDIGRIMMPFYEPWKEVMTTWGRLVKENPRVVRRGQQIIQGARTADPDGDGKGFFYTENGTEMFAYPGGHLLGKLLGLPGQVDFTAQAGGLNMVASSFLPGFGPAVQIPAGMLIPDRPKWDGLKEMVLPFGDPTDEGGTPGDILNTMLPAYMKRAVTALNADPNSDRIFANTVTDVMTVLASSGEYDNDMGMIDPEASVRLLSDAKSKAKRLYWIRALAQTTLPTGPQARMSIDTPEGLMALRGLVEEYRVMQQDVAAGGYDTALERFVQKFGYDATLAVQSKTQQIRYRSTDKVGSDWEREHADLIDDLPNVIGYFAPDDPNGDFDYTAYARQLRTGDRESLSPEEVLQLQNNTLGRMAYEKAQMDLGEMAATPQGEAVLARIRDNLRAEYPGFQTTVGIPKGADLETLVPEFARAVEMPGLRNTQVGRATREWLELREQAHEAARRIDPQVAGFERSSNPAIGEVRAWLRSEAEALIRRYPQWAGSYDRVFSRELDADEPEVPMTGMAA